MSTDRRPKPELYRRANGALFTGRQVLLRTVQRASTRRRLTAVAAAPCRSPAARRDAAPRPRTSRPPVTLALASADIGTFAEYYYNNYIQYEFFYFNFSYNDSQDKRITLVTYVMYVRANPLELLFFVHETSLSQPFICRVWYQSWLVPFIAP